MVQIKVILINLPEPLWRQWMDSWMDSWMQHFGPVVERGCLQVERSSVPFGERQEGGTETAMQERQKEWSDSRRVDCLLRKCVHNRCPLISKTLNHDSLVKLGRQWFLLYQPGV